MTHPLARLKFGITDNLKANWAAGRTVDLSFRHTGTTAAVCFSHALMNQFLVQLNDSDQARSGRIKAGPSDQSYGNFCSAAGHHLGLLISKR